MFITFGCICSVRFEDWTLFNHRTWLEVETLNILLNLTLHIPATWECFALHLVMCRCGFIAEMLIREMNFFVLFFVGRNLKFEYLYIKENNERFETIY